MLYNFSKIKKIYGSRIVLDLGELVIQAEKIYTLIGPNGAGKTTLLNILAFLENPSEGQIAFRGTNVPFTDKVMRQLRQRVVLVDQYPILFTGSVWKNIEFGLKIRRIPKERRREIVEEVLEMVGMQDFHDADAHKLSGGETKRVALARALAIKPEVLLCDEPTANVDVENQEIILNILERCNREDKLSLIFATHYFSQAQRLADQTIILQNGRLSGVTRDNLFSVKWVEASGKRQVWQVGGGPLLVDDGSLGYDLCKKHDKTRLFIDPKKIQIHNDTASDPNARNVWRGTICKINKENGWLRITVDTGLRIDILLPEDDYIKKPFYVSENVILYINDNSYKFVDE